MARKKSDSAFEVERLRLPTADRDAFYEALFRWALAWRQTPDSPSGPIELEVGEYTAAMAQPLFTKAVFEHCHTAIGTLERNLMEIRQQNRGRPTDVAMLAEGACVMDWARPYGLDRRWFVGRLGLAVGHRLLRLHTATKFAAHGNRYDPQYDAKLVGVSPRPAPIDPTKMIAALDSGAIYDNLVFRSAEPEDDPAFFAFYYLEDVLSRVGANPYSQSLDEFLDVARRHYHARASLLLALGARERRERSAKGKPSLADHCRWLALFHVEGLTVAEIARRNGRDRTAVSKGIHDRARLLEIHLRDRLEKGRPTVKTTSA